MWMETDRFHADKMHILPATYLNKFSFQYSGDIFTVQFELLSGDITVRVQVVIS